MFQIHIQVYSGHSYFLCMLQALGTDQTAAVPTNNNRPITSETTQTQFASLTPSATVVRDCQREAQQRVPVVWNAMCCQTCLANIYINTNSLQPRDQIIKRADAEADVSQRSEAACK